MNTPPKLIVLALFGLACGPPKLIGGESGAGESQTESESGDDATSRDEPANPSTSGNADTSTSETDTGESDTSDTSLFFVPMTEFGGCECDPFAQDCPDGEKCVPYDSGGAGSWDANKCVPVTGDQATGEPCVYDGLVEASDDCDANGICIDRDGDSLGTCHEFCMGTADQPECPDNLLCEIAKYGTVALCVEQCHPLLQDCSAPSGCYWDDTGFHCLEGGESAIGESCSLVNDCPPGNMCVEGALLPSCDGEACCTSICELGLDEELCLLPGSTCVPFFDDGAAPDGLEQVGLCLVPG